jgi:hypothetical protein
VHPVDRALPPSYRSLSATAVDKTVDKLHFVLSQPFKIGFAEPPFLQQSGEHEWENGISSSQFDLSQTNAHYYSV